MLTEKDFEEIAGTVKDAREAIDTGGAPREEYLAVRLADWLEEQNPRFDRDKFLKACGMEDRE